MTYPIKMNGYIYSKKTAEGFLRMKRHGIPRPLFSLERRLSKLLGVRFRRLARQLMKELKARLSEKGITTDAAPGNDSLEDLLSFFEEMGRKTAEENQVYADRANAQFIANDLESEWFEEVPEDLEHIYDIVDESFVPLLDGIFKKEQKDYLSRLYDDASAKFKSAMYSFSVDKKKFFDANMDAVRKLYVDNSLERIKGEENLIKRKILKRITDYALGNSATLNLTDLMKEAYDSSDNLSKLFARDQMQRFNKACTLATFRGAGVTKVKWMTAGDSRVRDSHRALNGKIFDVNNLPKEVDDYNCRCGLIPVEWADD